MSKLISLHFVLPWTTAPVSTTMGSSQSTLKSNLVEVLGNKQINYDEKYKNANNLIRVELVSLIQSQPQAFVEAVRSGTGSYIELLKECEEAGFNSKLVLEADMKKTGKAKGFSLDDGMSSLRQRMEQSNTSFHLKCILVSLFGWYGLTKQNTTGL